MNVLRLADSLKIGAGNNRICFQHPEFSERCVKVDKPGGNKLPVSQNQMEAVYYEKLSRIRANYDFQNIPQYFGTQATDHGTGFVFERIANVTDGATSPTIGQWLTFARTGREMIKLFEAIQRMRDNLIQHAIPVRDLGPANVCVQELSDCQYRMVAIDCIGHRDFIPLVDFVPWLARRKIRRHLSRHGWAATTSAAIKIQ